MLSISNWLSYACHDFWEYDPALNTWLQPANFGGTARYNAVSFVVFRLPWYSLVPGW